jgi:hypothetical protein
VHDCVARVRTLHGGWQHTITTTSGGRSVAGKTGASTPLVLLLAPLLRTVRCARRLFLWYSTIANDTMEATAAVWMMLRMSVAGHAARAGGGGERRRAETPSAQRLASVPSAEKGGSGWTRTPPHDMPRETHGMMVAARPGLKRQPSARSAGSSSVSPVLAMGPLA